jgi:hypothetical protein
VTQRCIPLRIWWWKSGSTSPSPCSLEMGIGKTGCDGDSKTFAQSRDRVLRLLREHQLLSPVW